MKLSVVLAVRNEEANLERCLSSVKSIADEIVVFDEYSTDATVKIAKKFGASVHEIAHQDNFHITKQKAIDAAHGEWILQLDADEQVSPQLAAEIRKVIDMSNTKLIDYCPASASKKRLFDRHVKILEQRDGMIGKRTGEVVAFFVPRLNLFLGKPLIHAGVYPDGVIRLIKRGKAFLPAKSVHEQMVLGGEVRWLENDLVHNDSPTISRYLMRLNRYTDLYADEIRKNKVARNAANFCFYTLVKPFVVFCSLYFRHLGFKDGIRGFLWSAFSAMHFPLAYYKYWTTQTI